MPAAYHGYAVSASPRGGKDKEQEKEKETRKGTKTEAETENDIEQ